MFARYLLPLAVCACLYAQPRQIHSWDEADKALAQLQTNDDDVATRTALLRFFGPQTPQSDRARDLRRDQLVWFVEHHPESLVLAEPASTVEPEGSSSFADPKGFAILSAAWQKALSIEKPRFDVFANAAVFYRGADPVRARQIVDRGLTLYPANSRISEVRGALLAYSVTGVKTLNAWNNSGTFEENRGKSAQSKADLHTLETTEDPNVAGGAADALRQVINVLRSQHVEDGLKTAEGLSTRLYEKAIAADPNAARWSLSLMSVYQSFAMTAATPSEKIAYLKKAMAAAPAGQRNFVLPDLALQYVADNKIADAEQIAKELLSLDRNSWNYGNAVFSGNIVLGRIALSKGDVDEAKRRLIAAGHAPTTPQLSSFGPTDWRLATDLLAAGERDTVLDYLEALRPTWTSGAARINSWTASIRRGGTPNFTGVGPSFPTASYVGRPAPEFRLMDMEGNSVALSEFKGKVVLLDFWATWCGPCRQEMPEFQRIHRTLASKDVVVLTIDVNETRDKPAEYMTKEKFTFPVLLGNGTDVMDRYGVHAYPTTFAIDKNGAIADVAQGSGPNSGARIDAMIAKARAGAPPPAAGSSPPSPGVSVNTRTFTPLTPASTAEDFFRDAVRQNNARDYSGALQSLSRTLEMRADWLPAVVLQADVYYRDKQYEKAIKGFTHAIELDPKRAASYDSRGLAYSYSGRHDQAIPDYTKSIELAPTSAAAFNNRGWAYLETGRLDEALADFDKALELNPSYSTALFNRAHLYEKRKEFAKAIADYDSVLHINPSDVNAARQRDAIKAPAANLAAPKPLR